MESKKASLSFIKAIVVLTAICLITSLALAAINTVTSPIISQAEKEAETNALKEVLPSAEKFEELRLDELSLDEKITAVYRDTAGDGFVFKIVTKGYKSKLTILCGIGADGKVAGATCLTSSETLGQEKTYGKNFIDKGADSVMNVDTVSGATLTTNAYRDAVKLALDAFNSVKD